MSETELFGYRLRPDQAAVLDYDGGLMAVSAVPGSGKTLTLSLLAARLIIEGRVGDEGEVLVVTMQNSAVDNIAQRIRRILSEQKLPPVGYHVCTLHKLAADILRRRRDLAGVEDLFFIVDQGETNRTMRSAVEVWIRGRRAWWASLLGDLDEARRERVLDRWREETMRVGREVVKLCKHLRLTPERAQELLDASGEGNPFLEMGVGLYAQYARYLQARSGLDFDDLIWRAIDALQQDETFLLNLRARWPYILEDEAQDSSPLQERILESLAGQGGNWVRVGDPNQAIHATFTAADPRYFRRFLRHDGVVALSLPESGRCAPPIMALANHLVRWACQEHPQEAVRPMAFRLQEIESTGPGDPQPNPPTAECHVHFREKPFADTESEARAVADWAVRYVRRHPRRTVAVLCPTHRKGSSVVGALKACARGVPIDDLLRSTPQTRQVAKVLAAACRYLRDPTNGSELARLYQTLARDGYLRPSAAEVGESGAGQRLRHQGALVRSLPPHELLFPRGSAHLRESLPPGVRAEREDLIALEDFAALTARWVRALALPIDQLLLTMGQDLFTEESDLAICHTLATSLRATSEMHPEWRLRDYAEEIGEVARNRRRLGGLSLADVGYTAREGHVAVTTMHRAKGLEWDAVVLMSVDSLEFPESCQDAFRDEPYFMPGRAPAVEARKRLEQLAGADFATPPDRAPVEQARIEYIAERLRLLYVGITRAKRDLVFSWSEVSGRRPVRPARALLELRAFWQAHGKGDGP